MEGPDTGPAAMDIHTVENMLIRLQMMRIEALLQQNLVDATMVATPGIADSRYEKLRYLVIDLEQRTRAMSEDVDAMRSGLCALRKKNSAE